MNPRQSQSMQFLFKLLQTLVVSSILYSSYFAVYIQVINYQLVGPQFVWLIPGWLRTNWWAAVDGINCTAEEMSKALEHSLGGRGNSVIDNDTTRILVSYKVCLKINYISCIYVTGFAKTRHNPARTEIHFIA